MELSLKTIPDLSSRFNGESGGENDRIKKIFEASILNPEDEIEKPEIVFGVEDPRNGNVWVASKGNISLLKGAQKSRKTFGTSAIAAVVAGHAKAINFKSYLAGPEMVLYVDTEQGKYDCKKVQKRMAFMSGLEMDKFKSNLMFLTLRPHSPKTRKDVIRYALELYGDKIALLVIDGIRDLVVDINDSSESTEIVTDLMAWSSDYNIHILNILHENKSNQNARGHLGTELQNKCESVFRISKLQQDDSCSVIESESMRGMSFDPIVFEIIDTDEEIGLPVVAEHVEVEVKEKQKGSSKKSTDQAFIIEAIPNNVHMECIRKVFMTEAGLFDDVDPLSARNFNIKIKKAMAEHDVKLSDHKARDLTDYYLKNKLLKDLNEGTESKQRKLVPGFDDDLPF